ncbi:MAG: hypothetical protein PHI40_07575 [Caldisericia bacterium]|nr:hypothetical protein [Caldisericia bacterium]MDD4615241.1 hypothetical protein [Caldisericia bacterium]
MDSIVLIVIVAIVFGGSLTALNIYFDKNRIRAKAEQLGYKEVYISWSPFAPGALFERNERHYRVSYITNDDVPHMRYCKTSIFTGVYWREEE